MVGIEIVFISPDNIISLYSFSPTKECSNNIAEYEAFITVLDLALHIPNPNLPIY